MYQLAFPRRHLDGNDPPMIFFTGGLDNIDTHAVPIRDDKRRLKISTGLLIIPGAPHSFFKEKRWSDWALSAAVFFFNEYL